MWNRQKEACHCRNVTYGRIADAIASGADTVQQVMEITGAGKGALPEITFTRVGVYEYTVSQLPGEFEGCQYDDSVYSLTVYVVNSETYDGLEATAVLYRNSEGDKLSEAAFTNVYPTVTPKPTEDPGEITDTGVRDVWPIYLAGAALLLIISGLLAVFLRRKDGNRGRRAE